MRSIFAATDAAEYHSTKIMETTKIRLSLELTEDQATDLAQFLKRVQFNDIRSRLKSDDETYTAINAIGSIQEALATAGFNPR
jgi:hypothetical protein